VILEDLLELLVHVLAFYNEHALELLDVLVVFYFKVVQSAFPMF